jgi:hypothetical protein
MILLNSITGFGFLQEGLRPLEYLDISKLYDSYTVFIDFAIYLMVFVGISQLTLGSRFQGRGGKAIAIAIGISLALSLAISEKYLGFSLRSLGPIAVGIFLAILSVIIYRLIKQLGGSFAVSGSLAYIIILLFLTATMPGFFAWINKNTPLLGLGLVAGFIWASYNVVSHLFRRKKLSQELGEKFDKVKTEAKGEIDNLDRSKRFQKANARRITKRAKKASREILEDLEEILKAIDKYGHLPEAGPMIKERIDKVMPEQLELVDFLTRLQNLHKRLLSFDTSLYSHELQTRYRNQTGTERAILKKELGDEYQKLGIERQLLDLEGKAQGYLTGMKNALAQAGQEIVSGNPDGAKGAIERAMTLEKETSTIIDHLRYQERQILKHTKREISMERKLEIVGTQ